MLLYLFCLMAITSTANDRPTSCSRLQTEGEHIVEVFELVGAVIGAIAIDAARLEATEGGASVESRPELITALAHTVLILRPLTHRPQKWGKKSRIYFAPGLSSRAIQPFVAALNAG